MRGKVVLRVAPDPGKSGRPRAECSSARASSSSARCRARSSQIQDASPVAGADEEPGPPEHPGCWFTAEAVTPSRTPSSVDDAGSPSAASRLARVWPSTAATGRGIRDAARPPRARPDRAAGVEDHRRAVADRTGNLCNPDHGIRHVFLNYVFNQAAGGSGWAGMNKLSCDTLTGCPNSFVAQ